MIEENRGDVWNIYYMRGICFEQLGDWDLAEKDFLKSLDIKPDSPNVLNYLAYSWLERNINIDKSIEMLEIALNDVSLDPIKRMEDGFIAMAFLFLILPVSNNKVSYPISFKIVFAKNVFPIPGFP